MRINHTVELTAGLFMVLGLAALTFLAFVATDIGSLSEQDSYQITARFNNVGALKPRAPVAVAGVNVGNVSEIRLDPVTFEAMVTMTINARYNEIPSDTSASIFTVGILGDKFIELDPGGSPDYLQNGDELFLTQSAVVLEKLVSKYLFNSESSDDNGDE